MRDVEIKEQPIVKCVSCDRFFVSGRWSERIEPLLSALVSAPARIIAVEPEGALSGRMPKRVHLLLEVDMDGLHEIELDLATDNTQCPDCSKKHSHYFEGTLQLRAGTPERYEEAKRLIEAHRGHVKAEMKRRDGIDYKVSSNKAIVATIKDLSARYIGLSHLSTTLHTRDHLSSKEKHRVTGLFRFFGLKKGDVILHEDAPFVIEKTKDKFCELRSLRDGRTTIALPLEELENRTLLEPFDTSVVTTRPALSILSESYVDVPAVNRSAEELEAGDDVRAVGHEDFYAVLSKR